MLLDIEAFAARTVADFLPCMIDYLDPLFKTLPFRIATLCMIDG